MFSRDEHVKMPANFEWDVDFPANDWDTDPPEFNDIEFSLTPSEDFWSKFEELPDFGADLESLLESDMSGNIRNHDCMWAGTCHNKEHKDVKKEKTRGVIVQKTVGRSLLIRNRQTPPRPETPSLSEEEDEKPIPINVMSGKRILYLNQRVPPMPTQPITSQDLISSNVIFDHTYDKQVRSDDLGVQTPSDSEEEEEEEEEEAEQEESEDEKEEEEEEESDEEIDVVNLRETLPTNPSRQDRFKLQQQMATAITTSPLLNASRAVSRRLTVKEPKRKRRSSDTEDDTESDSGRKKWRSPKKSRYPTDSEPDSEKRSMHNNMERMRRIELRNAFEDLRGLVPSLTTNSRAPKVTILKDATSYLYDLKLKDKTLQMQVSELRSDQERLRTTLSRLRRSLAVTRR